MENLSWYPQVKTRSKIQNEKTALKSRKWKNCPGTPTVINRSKIQTIENCSKILEWQNFPDNPTVKTHSKIQVVKNPSKIKVAKNPSKIWESKNCPGTPTPILLLICCSTRSQAKHIYHAKHICQYKNKDVY